MRITRSGLRRIIAEESARILAESKKNPHERVPGGHQMRMAAGFEDEPEEEDWEDADKTDEEWYAEQHQGVMDMYGDPNPYGDDEAAMGDLEYDGAGGWKKPSLDEGEDDDLGGAASATDSGDRESRRGEHLGDDPDMGPPGHDDWHIDTYEDEDIEGSDFDEMIDPADDNDDPMKPAWMQNLPYSNEPEDWEFADDPYVGGRAASPAIRQKYSETGDSDPEDDRSLPRGHRYGIRGGWGGLDEARWAKLAGILKD